MLLKNKTVVIYGAAGHLGGSIATACSREGARLFLTGRTLRPVEWLAQSLGCRADQVDALDEAAVERHADEVIKEVGRIDISINAVSEIFRAIR